MRISVRAAALLAVAALATSLVAAPASAATTPAPKAVQAQLKAFDKDPQKAMIAWTNWAKSQPMSVYSVYAGGKSLCLIDAKGTSKCGSWNRRPSGSGYTPAGVIYTYPNKRTQVFRYKGKWVYNQFGADTNPITNSKRFYRYDVWLPWQSVGVPVSTMTDANGWHVATATNVNPGDDQSQVTVTKVSPDGSRALFIEQDKKGRVQSKQLITLRPVPTIQIPKASKQVL